MKNPYFAEKWTLKKLELELAKCYKVCRKDTKPGSVMLLTKEGQKKADLIALAIQMILKERNYDDNHPRSETS